MSDLKYSRSAPTPSPGSRAQLPRGRSNTASRSDLTQVYSAQHLDDASNYHGGDHVFNQDEGNETDCSDKLEQVRNQDYDDAAREGEDEFSEVRMGVLDIRDLEANLEKKPTTRSVKDPNLVRVIDAAAAAEITVG